MKLRLVSRLTILCVGAYTALGATEEVPGKPLVLVSLKHGSLSTRYLRAAELVAEKILSAADIRLKWSSSKFSIELRQRATLLTEVDLLIDTPVNFRPASLAYTNLSPQSGRRIIVFWDRVQESVREENWSKTLGHVMAHEITHILQRRKGHSTEGLMMAHWATTDLSRMAFSALLLSSDDIELIRQGMNEVSRTKPTVRISPPQELDSSPK